MNARFLRVLFAFMALAIAVPSVPVSASSHLSGLAPADEYFGRMKMSILGIRNSIRDLGTQASYSGMDRASLRAKAAFTEDALADWQRKYPRDPWIPRFRGQLASIYSRLASR